jgi:hypothetical protein
MSQMSRVRLASLLRIMESYDSGVDIEIIRNSPRSVDIVLSACNSPYMGEENWVDKPCPYERKSITLTLRVKYLVTVPGSVARVAISTWSKPGEKWLAAPDLVNLSLWEIWEFVQTCINSKPSLPYLFEEGFTVGK